MKKQHIVSIYLFSLFECKKRVQSFVFVHLPLDLKEM